MKTLEELIDENREALLKELEDNKHEDFITDGFTFLSIPTEKEAEFVTFIESMTLDVEVAPGTCPEDEEEIEDIRPPETCGTDDSEVGWDDPYE